MLSIPVFVKVDQLKLGTSGHTLTVKVVGQTSVPQKPNAASSHLRPNRIAKCLVGDETASILFTARNDQGELRGFVRERLNLFVLRFQKLNTFVHITYVSLLECETCLISY